MMIALVAMFVMTMSANAQSNDQSLMFKRMSCYLELTEGQMESVKTSMTQLSNSLEALSLDQRRFGKFRAANKIVAHHKKQMKHILSEEQYNKFEEIFDLTIANTVKINVARL